MLCATLTKGSISQWYLNSFHCSWQKPQWLFSWSWLCHFTPLLETFELHSALCLNKPITSTVLWACQLNLTDGEEKARIYHKTKAKYLASKASFNTCVIEAFVLLSSLEGSSNLIGQAVLWLHPWHHSHHPRCTHQQLWNYQAAGTERGVYAAATWGGPSWFVVSIVCICICVSLFCISFKSKCSERSATSKGISASVVCSLITAHFWHYPVGF